MSNINFSEQEIRDVIVNSLTGPHKDLLADAIIGLMDGSDFKKGVLLKATLGTKRECELTLNDEYYVTYTHVSNYNFDEMLMKEKGMINSSDQIKCILVRFNPWSSSPYAIKYKYLDTGGNEKSASYDVSIDSLQVVEEFPEDF